MKDKEVFTQIWLRPRPVFRFIETSGYQNYFYLILTLSGIASVLQRKLDKGVEQDSVASTLLISIIFGGLLGWLGIYIYAGLIRFTGEWIDGKAITHRIYRALAYANIPTACTIVIHLAQLYMIKYGVFDEMKSDNEASLIQYGLISIKAIFMAWTMTLYVIAVAEVQRFSIGKAILNLILPILLFTVPIGILLLIAYSYRFY